MIFLFLIRIFSFGANNISMISFDEGPSNYIYKLVDMSIRLDVPVVFHLNPFNELFNKRAVDYLIDSGFEVGLAITEQINEKREDIEKVINKYEKEFIKKSGYKPVLLRLPSVGIISKEAYSVSESMGYLVDTPNFDSEDDQKSDIWPFLVDALNKETSERLSFVFRDRYEKSVNMLRDLTYILRNKGYKIVPAYEYLNKKTDLIPVNPDKKNRVNKKSDDDKKPIYLTKFEVQGESIPTGIRVYTTKDGILIKEMNVPYSIYNKLIVRELLKAEIGSEGEIDDLYEEISNKCTDEDDECKILAENGEKKGWSISIIALSILLLM